MSGARTLILVRHGQSTGNAAGEFSGARDVPLTMLGREQARTAGRHLSERGLRPGAVFCSTRSRTRESADLILEAVGRPGQDVVEAAALDERDYGALTGLTHRAAEARWGAVPSRSPRPRARAYGTRWRAWPPITSRGSNPPAMRGVAMVVAHGNSLRALVAAIEGLTPDAIEALELPTGSVRLYQLAADTTIEASETLT
ncbi:phosphoglycerate mutase [Methylobacterium sp. DB1607]|nr:phosphoglycerate mutase [Methylobacterium sp. DB1607]